MGFFFFPTEKIFRNFWDLIHWPLRYGVSTLTNCSIENYHIIKARLSLTVLLRLSYLESSVEPINAPYRMRAHSASIDGTSSLSTVSVGDSMSIRSDSTFHYGYLHLHEIVEGLFFFITACLCVCLCVWLCMCVNAFEQNSSQTDATIWTQFSLNSSLPHWLEPYRNWWPRVKGQGHRNSISIFSS